MQRDSLKGKAWDAALSLARWADQYAYAPSYAAEGINLVFGDGIDMAGQMLRGLICAPPGRVLLHADFSAVEARGVAWLAGCDKLLQWFREGRKVYEEMAASIFGIPPEEVGEDSIERQLGKQVILGGGYGMSGESRNGKPSTFLLTCEGYGIKCTPELASQAIRGYRETFPEIPALWRAAEDAAKEAIRTGRAVRVNTRGPDVIFKMVDRHLLCKLPSGRKIAYPFAALGVKPAPWDPNQLLEVITFMEEGKNGHWMRGDTYGGKLTENICQAVCRDLERDSMVRVEATGRWEVVHHCHDEIVSETDEKPEAELAAEWKEYTRTVSQVEPWAATFPLKSSGWFGKRYRK
jgi:DNA polymerase